MDDGLVLKNVKKTYQQGDVQVHALRGIDLSIPEGSFASICGPSGSGKTTLLNLVGGLDTPTEGEIFIAGERVDQMSKRKLAELRLHHVGFVFQAYNLIPVLTALENVAFVMELQGVPAQERKSRAMQVLEEVGLGGMEKRRPAELSGGQQQRVAVARAIVSSPSIVLADEPTANLDSETAKSLLELMKKMNQQKGVTFLFSTHDPLVMEYARRVITLRDGKISADQQRRDAESH